MKITRILTKKEWDQELLNIAQFDLYHTFDFHEVHKKIDGGKPILYSIYDGDDYIFFPLLERMVKNTLLKDATSVYGYPGPLSNIRHSDRFNELWNVLIHHFTNNENYISLFSRLNSISTNEEILAKRFIEEGNTININLMLTEEEQKNKYRSNHKRDINKLMRDGFECSFTTLEEGLDDFINIYNSTMLALDASPYYIFNKEYYQKLFKNNQSEIKLIQCRQNEIITCMGIFSFTNDIVQYHLGGTAKEYYKFAPTKLMFDYVRRLSSRKGYKYLHLGGGLGGRKDNLFNFKLGFSDDIKTFYICKDILNSVKYSELSANKNQSDFFPLYRS